MNTNRAFLDGLVMPSADARLPVSDEGLLHGLGFFETFRTSGGRPHHWKFNRARLETACAKGGIDLPDHFLGLNEDRLLEVVGQLLRESGQLDAVFRYTITAGTAGKPSEILTLRPLPATAPEAGIDLRVLCLRRDSGEWIPRPKSLNYANARLGARELQLRNAEPSDEGLYLSREGGLVVETTRQNIAWVVGDRIFHPDSSVGAVGGTCVAWLESRGFSLEPARAALNELLQADAIVCLNAVRGITAVARVWDERDENILATFNSIESPRVRAMQTEWQDALLATSAEQ